MGKRGTFRCLQLICFCALSLIRCVTSHSPPAFVGSESALYFFFASHTYIFVLRLSTPFSHTNREDASNALSRCGLPSVNRMWRHIQTRVSVFFEGFGGQKGRLLAQTLFERESLARESRLGHSYSADSGWGEGGRQEKHFAFCVAPSICLYVYVQTHSS